MGIHEKMTALADAVRAATGTTGLLTLDGMTEKAAQFFSAVIHGDDTNALSISIPFAPDFFVVESLMPYTVQTASTYIGVVYDARSPVKVPAAFLQYVKADGTRSNANVSYDTAKSLFTYADGVFSASAAATAELQNAKWRSAAVYVICACKYAVDKTDAEWIAAQLRALPDAGGTLTLSQSAVNAAMTDAAWTALIAEKPNWTFTLS